MAIVHVFIPGTPDGTEIEVPGLGLFPNGGDYEVDDEKIATFNAINLAPFPEGGELFLGELPVEPEADKEPAMNPFVGKNISQEGN
jgi:hypothetical protein